MTAPQRKMQRKRPRGMNVQVNSRALEPSICSAWWPLRRRYRMAKTVIMVKIASAIDPHRINRNMYRASTFPAIVEALSGQSGRLSNMVIQSVLFPRVSVAPKHQNHESAQQ